MSVSSGVPSGARCAQRDAVTWARTSSRGDIRGTEDMSILLDIEVLFEVVVI